MLGVIFGNSSLSFTLMEDFLQSLIDYSSLRNIKWMQRMMHSHIHLNISPTMFKWINWNQPINKIAQNNNNNYISRSLNFFFKLTFRCWVLLDHTYTIYIFSEGVLRTSSEPYDVDNLKNITSHLTNHCIQVNNVYLLTE